MIEWSESFETGDNLVDQQHQSIHQISRSLDCAEDTPREIMRALDELMVHVEAHFATEEDLMAREEFPTALADIHRDEHARLTADVRSMVLDFHTGKLTSIAPTQQFVADWLARHVHERDRDLVDFVRERGGAARLPERLASRQSASDPAS